MNAHLGGVLLPFQWLFEPSRPTTEKGRSFLMSQLLGAPASALMGSFCAIIVLIAAKLRTGSLLIDVFLGLECGLAVLRVMEWRLRKVRLARSPSGSISIDPSVLLSVTWCSLQGIVAFTLLRGGDPVLQVLSATLVMALLGPLCARNYAAPRFAMLLVLVCDLPFVAGAVLSGEPMLSLIALMTPPFLLGAMIILKTFHNAILSTLEAEQVNKHMATHDSLTGVLNRQGMDEALERVTSDRDRTMALLSIDLDGFKQINDTYGHGAGDVALVEVTRRIGENLRGTDLVARMGGDEFMVILFNMDPHAILPVATALIDAISGRPIPVGPDTQVTVGASVGYACLPQDAGTTVELRLMADRALYDAKDAGKGRARRFRQHEEARQRSA